MLDLNKAVQKLGYSSYQTYLASTHWYNVRQRLFKSKLIKRNELGMPCCAFCRKSEVIFHVHHKSYKALGKEPLMHLELLCELCHSFVHRLCDELHLNLWTGTKRAKSIIQKQDKVRISQPIIMPKHTNINFGSVSQLRKRNGLCL